MIVQDDHGRPVDGTLRIRDRMSEQWHQLHSGEAGKIPYPPAVRMHQGRSTLPSVQAGQLELSVELDDGRAYPFVARTDLTRPLSLRLPRD